MKGEFCRVLTSDRLELQGLLAAPEGGPSDTSVLHIHGLAGNFYENRFIDYVAGAVASQGINFLTINTRGRDYISDFFFEREDGITEYRQIGGVYELFHESIEDISAWVEFLKARGSRRIILQGHSHGALKATYYVHKIDEPVIAGLILLSPSDDFGRQRKRLGERFDEALGVAGKMIDAGRGRELIPSEYFHYPVSANTYSDIFNPNSSLKMFNLSKTDRDDLVELGTITLPTLVVVGSVDEEFIGSPSAYLSGLKAHFKNAMSFTGRIIEGAPHNYLHFESEVARHIGEWLASNRAGG